MGFDPPRFRVRVTKILVQGLMRKLYLSGISKLSLFLTNSLKN